MSIKINKVLAKPITVHAVQFDGTNGKEIVEWINSTENCLGQKARNGGNWISISTTNVDGETEKLTVRKSDVVYLDVKFEFFMVMPIDVFDSEYKINKSHSIVV